jgi:hypothetical protein
VRGIIIEIASAYGLAMTPPTVGGAKHGI